MSTEAQTLTLAEAMAQNAPPGLHIWLALLVATNFAAALFIVGRKDGRWIFRPEPVAIIVAFLVASVIMGWVYARLGYVRLLGIGHLIGWTPAYLWIWSRRKLHDPGTTLFGKYLLVYLVLNGISLFVDFVDLIRYFVGI